MGIRGELFTTQIHVENRTYFFNVKENRLGDVFLQIVESKNTDGAGFDRHAIVVFQDEMQTFLQGLNQSLDFIEQKHKEQLKEKRAKKQRMAAQSEGGSVPDKKQSSNGGKVLRQKNPRKIRIITKGTDSPTP
ncbi:MAG: PUR family DNA/RNA-binding protein [Treponema sp.]